jgi:hypothetical protein
MLIETLENKKNAVKNAHVTEEEAKQNVTKATGIAERIH